MLSEYCNFKGRITHIIKKTIIIWITWLEMQENLICMFCIKKITYLDPLPNTTNKPYTETCVTQYSIHQAISFAEPTIFKCYKSTKKILYTL